jgi:hypothetical protein
MEKAIGWVCFPPMASLKLSPKPSGGAGYGHPNSNGKQLRKLTDREKHRCSHTW